MAYSKKRLIAAVMAGVLAAMCVPRLCSQQKEDHIGYIDDQG